MGTDKLVYIRTDGNEQIASGHLMRCVTIAAAIVKQGGNVCFLVSDEESRAELTMRLQAAALQNVQLLVLHTQYNDLEKETQKLLALFDRQPAAVMLLDSYFVTETYFTELQKKIRIVYLDDLQLFDYPADIIINYDAKVDETYYKRAGKRYTGVAYAPLRPQFADAAYEVRSRAEHLLLTTGGSDPDNFCGTFVTYLAQQPEGKKWNVHVVVGSMFSRKEELRALQKQLPNVFLHENVTEMAELMQKCDVAVSAGGTTLFELCAVGVPTWTISISKQQLPCNRAFEKAGLLPYAGDIHAEGVVEELYAKVMDLGNNLSERKQRSIHQRQAIDGQGAQRIAKILLSWYNERK